MQDEIFITFYPKKSQIYLKLKLPNNKKRTFGLMRNQINQNKATPLVGFDLVLIRFEILFFFLWVKLIKEKQFLGLKNLNIFFFFWWKSEVDGKAEERLV